MATESRPIDLRLLPPAAAAWGAAAWAPSAPRAGVLLLAGLALTTAVLLVVVRRHGALSRICAVALLCGAASAVVAAGHAADLHRGPLPRLAAQHARVGVEFTVTTDPRGPRPSAEGAAGRGQAVVEATARRVDGPDGVTRVRTPVLVVARGPGAEGWLSLLPSARVVAEGRLGEGDGRVAAVLHVSGAPRICAPPNRIQRIAGELRSGLREATDGLSPDARALVPGLAVGDTSRMPPELVEDFRATDLSHLLAVSGANLSILLFVLVGPPGRAARAERGGLAPRLGVPLRVTAVLGGLLTLGFVVLCRPDPSVLRAAACGLITLVAIGTGRRRSLVPALAAAVLLLVLFLPRLARSYGFLLSVLATAALLVLAPRWSRVLRDRGVPGRLAEVVAAAAAAQVVCAPVVAVMAARVSLVAIPCNLLAELAVAPATVLAFAALAAAPVAMPLARWLAWLAGWPAEWIAAVARTGAGLPGAQVDWPGGWAGGLALAVVTVAGVLTARRLLHSAVLSAVVVLVLVAAVLRPVPLPRVLSGWPPGEWRIAACDVGQGDAIVLSAGRGSAVVVDTGPDPRAVDACLRDLSVTRVPLVVLSHFHADHVAGLPGVLRGRAVGAVQTTGWEVGPPERRAPVERQAATADLTVLRATAGEARSVGPLSWRVLWPPPSVPLDQEPNNTSVVMLVRVAGLTALLLGDLEPWAQRRLLAALPDLPRVDVLKVAHHGSAHQDPDLLRRLRPRIALVSAGRENPYGHPSPRTVAALRALGSTVLRTDTDGSVAVLGSGGSLRAVTRR
nr:ComEC/Rec2 family competence protein [Wenjunlia vitaminophila]